MRGPSIVGFGSYRYAYESGHTGEAPHVETRNGGDYFSYEMKNPSFGTDREGRRFAAIEAVLYEIVAAINADARQLKSGVRPDT